MLENCPICGTQPLRRRYGLLYGYSCANCISVKSGKHFSIDKAEKDWNSLCEDLTRIGNSCCSGCYGRPELHVTQSGYYYFECCEYFPPMYRTLRKAVKSWFARNEICLLQSRRRAVVAHYKRS